MKAIMSIAIVCMLAFTSTGYAQWETAHFLVGGWKATQKLDTDNRDVGEPEYLQAGVYLGYIMGFLHGTWYLYKIPTNAQPK